MATTCLLLSPFTGQAEDTGESRVIDTIEGINLIAVQQSGQGMLLDIAPVDKDDKSVSRRIPSDCPECGLECMMPSLFRFESGRNHTELGGGVLTVTVENPSICVRIDGFRRKRDSLIHLAVTNGRKDNYSDRRA